MNVAGLSSLNASETQIYHSVDIIKQPPKNRPSADSIQMREEVPVGTLGQKDSSSGSKSIVQ